MSQSTNHVVEEIECTQAGLKPPGEQTQIGNAVRFEEVTKRLARRRFWKQMRLIGGPALIAFTLVMFCVLFYNLYRKGPYLHRQTTTVIQR